MFSFHEFHPRCRRGGKISGVSKWPQVNYSHRTSMGTDKESPRGGPIRNIYFGRENMVLQCNLHGYAEPGGKLHFRRHFYGHSFVSFCQRRSSMCTKNYYGNGLRDPPGAHYTSKYSATTSAHRLLCKTSGQSSPCFYKVVVDGLIW